MSQTVRTGRALVLGIGGPTQQNFIYTYPKTFLCHSVLVVTQVAGSTTQHKLQQEGITSVTEFATRNERFRKLHVPTHSFHIYTYIFFLRFVFY